MTTATISGTIGLPEGTPHLDTMREWYQVENPQYLSAREYGRWYRHLPQYLEYYDDGPEGELFLPRGAREDVDAFYCAYGITIEWRDLTRVVTPVAFDELLTLTPVQEAAVQELRRHDTGILEAPCGAGKTYAAMALIARRRQPSLFLVHTKELVDQTIRAAGQMLGLEPQDIGLYGSGQKRLGERLTVGLVQTLAKGVPLELQEHIGHAIVDECHRCPTEQTSRVLRQLGCRYLTGLTATPYRRDAQLSPVIPWHVGPVRYRIERSDLSDRLIHPEVVRLDTAMVVEGDSFSEIVSRLVTSHRRNLILRDHAVEAVRQGRRCILLSDRVEHCELLADMLKALGVSAAPIHGQLPKALRQRAIAALADGRLQAATATYQLLSEGFNCPPISWLCLATPVSYRGKVIQAAGRAMRTAPGKTDAVIVDLMDHHPMLYASWSKRRQAYESLGLDIVFVAPYGTATYPEKEEITV